MRLSEEDLERFEQSDFQPAEATNPIVLAMKPLGAGGVPEIEDPARRLRAGACGVILGVVVFPIGIAVGSMLMPIVLNAIFGPGPGEVHVPRVVVVALFGLAVWGGIMFLVGWLRILQSVLRRSPTWAAMAVLPIMAIGYLWILMLLFVR